MLYFAGLIIAILIPVFIAEIIWNRLQKNYCTSGIQNFLITKELYDIIQNKDSFNATNEGQFTLKGKKEKVTIYSIER